MLCFFSCALTVTRRQATRLLPAAAALALCATPLAAQTDAAGAPAASPDDSATSAAATPAAAADQPVTHMNAVEVRGREDELVGIADSATQGTISATELAYRPILRAGEILETIPGVIITMHAGGGKAPQYFTRGFNLDHGTDFAIDIDGMPLNLGSHIHGQGYADMNIVIPELIDKMDYEKGPYFAANGDFATAGAAHIVYATTEPENYVKVEGGSDGFVRTVVIGSLATKTGNFVYGFEAYHENGPWAVPDNYMRYNAMLRYSSGTPELGYSITGMLDHGRWNATDQVSASAVDSKLISFYGTQDPTDGGLSERISLEAEWHRKTADTTTSIEFFTYHYTLNLLSDFTYYLDSPDGDQFDQDDVHNSAGLRAKQVRDGTLAGKRTETTFGMIFQNYWINTGLYQTIKGIRSNKVDYEGNVVPVATKVDSTTQSQGGIYVSNQTWWTDWFRSEVGVRGDAARMQVRDDLPENSDTQSGMLASPKLSLIFGPWDQTEFYVQGGYGYHSNDARAATAVLEPDGTPVGARLPVLIPAYGGEFGIRTSIIPKLQSTLSFWGLHNKSELYFNGIDGDNGNIANTAQGTRRFGVEWTNYYTPVDWLTFDLDLADSSAHFTSPTTAAEDATPGGTLVDEAIHESLSGGVTLHRGGWSTTLRMRYFGPRPLVSDGSVSSASTSVVNLGLGYVITSRWKVTCDFLNLLDRKDHDIDYYYNSRDTPTSPVVSGDHFHPVEPFEMRMGFQVRL